MNKEKLLDFEIQELETGAMLETLIGEGGPKGGNSGGGGGSGSSSQDPTGMGPDGMFSGVDLGSSGGGGLSQDPTGMGAYGMFSPGRDESGAPINGFANNPGDNSSAPFQHEKVLTVAFGIKNKVMDRNKNLGVAGVVANVFGKVAARDKDSLYNKITANQTIKDAVESNPYSHIGMMTAAYGAEYAQTATEKVIGPSAKAIADLSARAFQSVARSMTSQPNPGSTSDFHGASLTHDAPPVVLDLDGDGIELISLEDSNHFYDFDDDGLANQTAWVSSDDGILARGAVDGDGIPQASEIRFDGYAQQAITEADVGKHDFNADGAVDINDFDTDGNGVISDLEGLRYFDSNKDGILDSADDAFDSFGVLSDFNDDGRTGQEEFQTLSEMGIDSINLSSDQINRVQSGSVIVGLGTYTKTDGSEQALADTVLKFTPQEYGILEGGAGDDTLSADFDKAAAMYGGAGNDALYGSKEGDMLSGNSGADVLRGGAGDDTYVFGRGFGHDTVIDQQNVTWNYYSESGWIGTDGKQTFDKNFDAADPSGKKDTQIVTWSYYSNSGWVGEDGEGKTFDKNNAAVVPAGEKGKQTVTWNCYASKTSHQSDWVGVDGTGKTFDESGDPVAPQGRKNYQWSYSSWIGYHVTGAKPVTRTYDIASETNEYTLESIDEQFDAGNDTLILGENIALSDLVFKSEDGDLKIGIADESQNRTSSDSFGALSDVVTLKDFFNEKSRVETLRFSDGTTLDLTRLIDASHIKEGEIIAANETIQSYFKDEGISLSVYDVISGRHSDIVGDNGDNELSAGRDSASFMRGGDGNDTISGSQENDMLSGDSGSDILRGGAGDDTYLFGRGFGRDTLIDESAITWNHYSESGWMGTDGVRTFDEEFHDAAPSGKKDTRNMTWNYYSLSGWIGVDENGKTIDKSGQDATPAGVINRALVPGISPWLQTIFWAMGIDLPNSYKAPETSEFAVAPKSGQLDAGHDTLILGDDIAPHDLAFKVQDGDLKIGILDENQPGAFNSDSFETISDVVVLKDFFNEKSRIENIRFADGMTCDLKTLVDFMGTGEGETAKLNDKMTNYLEGQGVYVSSDDTAFAADKAMTEVDNVLTGSAANDVIDGGQGDDVVSGGDGDDGLYGGVGQDILWGGAGNDFSWGGDSNDVLFGEDGRDSLFGDDGDDVIFGGDGNDLLSGGAGNDTLSGENGNDRLTGGAGNDTYRFGAGHGNDIIMNYDADAPNDRVIFQDGINPEDIWLRRGANHLVLETLGTGDSVSIQNWYLRDEFQVDRLEVSSGSFLMASDVQNLVDAMARFSADQIGIAQLEISELPDSLQPVIAANWQS